MENNPLEYSSDGDFDVCWRMQNSLSDTWKKVEQCKLGDGVVTMIAFSHCSLCVCIGCELSCASVGCCLSVKFRPNRWFVCRVISTTCQHFPSQICQNKSRLRHLFSFHPTCFALFSIFSIMFIYKRVAIHLRCEAFFCDFFRLCVILFCMCSFSKVNVKLEIFFPFLLQLCLYLLPLLIQMMRMKMNLTIRMNQQKQMMTVAFIKTQEIHHHLTAHVMKNKPLYWDKNAWENAHRMKTAKVKRKNAYAMELAECRALNQVVQWNRKNMILFRAHEPSFLTFSMK